MLFRSLEPPELEPPELEPPELEPPELEPPELDDVVLSAMPPQPAITAREPAMDPARTLATISLMLVRVFM